jgi:hypothetical protein
MPFDNELEISVEQIEENYVAMQDSVYMINADILKILKDERKDRINRNIEHLELMLSKEYWTDEDMTAVHAAIAAGKEYLKA